MKSLVPLLIIEDQCEEALTFYKGCFGGEISNIIRFSDFKGYEPEPWNINKLAHSEFKAEGIHFFASDGYESGPEIIGSNVVMCVAFDSKAEQYRVFDDLKVGGIVEIDKTEVTESSTMLVLEDKYGIIWRLYLEKELQK